MQIDGGPRYLQKLYDMYLIERISGSQKASGIVQDSDDPATAAAAATVSAGKKSGASDSGSGKAKGSGAGRGGSGGRGKSRGRGGGAGSSGRAPVTRKEQGMYKCAVMLRVVCIEAVP